MRVEGLKTYFHTYEGIVRALEGITFEVMKGETMGLVGETGCGKSVTALSIMGLIPRPPGKIEAGEVYVREPSRVTALRKDHDSRVALQKAGAREKLISDLESKFEALSGPEHESEKAEIRDQLSALRHSCDVLRMSSAELDSIRGARISMIFQEPMTALNPTMTIGNQIGETIELHQLNELIDVVLRQLKLERDALEKGKTGYRQRPDERPISGGEAPPSQARESSSGQRVCSECGNPVRDDWGACLSCGVALKSRSSSLLPTALRRLRLGLETRYYERMKENSDNTIAYFVRNTPVIRRLTQRRLKLAKLMRAEFALKDVKIAEPGRIARSYPFELSGGMKQRAMIAMMMACRPDLLSADEATTALDVTVEAQILGLMRELKSARGTSILLITHDLGIIAENCQRVAVMYAGYIAELSAVRDIFLKPMHPYTNALLRSIPKIGPAHMRTRKQPLNVIPGVVPNLLTPPTGCRFHPRCDRMLEICRSEVPELLEVHPGHFVACHNPVMASKEAG
ncbi:MAG: ABC transporter ATP-binding protein [Thermoplasmata archaeon]